jgi:hypothetical protein
MTPLRTRLATTCASASLTLFLLLSAPLSSVAAEDVYVASDTVTLATLLPVLAGSELGDLPIAKAPLPGTSSVIRGSDVKAKLVQAGHDARGLAIPKSTRVTRRAQTLTQAELRTRVSTLLRETLAPCELGNVSELAAMTLGEGEFELTTASAPRRSSGRNAFTLTLRQGETEQRLHGQVEVRCPPPVVTPGASVKLTVTSGAVRVSAPATANQPGQPGDEIRVTSGLNRQSYRARVVDATSVELVR